MDKASHLSVVLDLSPTQWHLSMQPNNVQPLTLSTFISQLLAFLNAHMACKDENSLAVFGAFPGKRFDFFSKDVCRTNQAVIDTSVMLFSTTAATDDTAVAADANAYRPFKILDTAVTQSMLKEIEALGDDEIEGREKQYRNTIQIFNTSFSTG